MTLKQHTFSLFRLICPLFLLLTACSPSPADTELPTPSPSSVVLSDCFWSATAVAWLDANGNGVRDEAELPLAGIEFVLEPTVYSRTTSGTDGIAQIFATTPTAGTDTTCEELQAEMPFQVIAARFEGYSLTTPGALAYTSSDVEYAFGFQVDAALAAPISDLLVTTEKGYALAPDWGVTQVNYLFEWYGEDWPVWEYEQIAAAADGQFHHGNGTEVTAAVQELLTSLHGLTPVSEVRHTNLWTDDYPKWFVELWGTDGQSILVYSESTGFRGHAPWYVQIGDQLYRQTNGDIGFALYPLVSETAQRYFSLDEQPFDETLLEPDSRPSIFHKEIETRGLLPIVQSLTYQFDPASNTLDGSFIWLSERLEYDSSSQPIIGVTTTQLVLPDGTAQPCSISSAVDETYPSMTHWSFSCPLEGESFSEEVQMQVVFATANEGSLMVEGKLIP